MLGILFFKVTKIAVQNNLVWYNRILKRKFKHLLKGHKMKKLICMLSMMIAVATPSFAGNEAMSQAAVSMSNSSMLQTVVHSNNYQNVGQVEYVSTTPYEYVRTITWKQIKKEVKITPWPALIAVTFLLLACIPIFLFCSALIGVVFYGILIATIQMLKEITVAIFFPKQKKLL